MDAVDPAIPEPPEVAAERARAAPPRGDRAGAPGVEEMLAEQENGARQRRRPAPRARRPARGDRTTSSAGPQVREAARASDATRSTPAPTHWSSASTRSRHDRKQPSGASTPTPSRCSTACSRRSARSPTVLTESAGPASAARVGRLLGRDARVRLDLVRDDHQEVARRRRRPGSRTRIGLLVLAGRPQLARRSGRAGRRCRAGPRRRGP